MGSRPMVPEIVPSSSALFNFIWVLFFGLLFFLGESFFDIAMNVLALKLLQNPKDRKNFYTLSSLAASLGSMLPGWLIPIAVGTTAIPHKQQWLYFFVALGFCMAGVSCMYAPSMTIDMTRSIFFQPVKASDLDDDKPAEKVHWNKKTIGLILHNRPFIIVQLSLLCDMIRQVTYTALPYLYKDVLNDYGMKAIIDMISGALSYVGLFAVPIIGAKVSARNIVAGGYSYTSFFYLILSFFNIGAFAGSSGIVGNSRVVLESIRRKKWIIGVLIGIAGMPNAAQSASRNIVVADSTDYMEWYAEKKYGEPMRNDGLLIAAQGLMKRFNDLFKQNLYNGLFILTGYKSKDLKTGITPVQTPEALRNIYTMITLCGFIGNLIAAICFMFDNYTGKRQKMIFEELTEFRKARAALNQEMNEETSTEKDEPTE